MSEDEDTGMQDQLDNMSNLGPSQWGEKRKIDMFESEILDILEAKRSRNSDSEESPNNSEACDRGAVQYLPHMMDEHELFLNSLASRLRIMDETTRLLVKMKMLQLVYDSSHPGSNRIPHQQYHPFYHPYNPNMWYVRCVHAAMCNIVLFMKLCINH